MLWWSSSLNSATNAARTSLSGTGVYPGTQFNDRYFGNSVRCVLDSVPAADSPLQAVTPYQCAAMAYGDVITLRDARDDKQYRIKKMPDNKCWLLDNLAYVGGGANTYGDVVPASTSTAATAPGVLIRSNGTGSSGSGGTLSTNWTQATGANNRYITNNMTEPIDTTAIASDGYPSGGPGCSPTAATLDPNYPPNQGNQYMLSICGDQYLYNWCAAIGLDTATTPACNSTSDTGSGTGYARTGIIGKSGGQGGESKGYTSRGQGGTGTLPAGNTGGVSSNTQGSICPAGWRFPSGRVGASNDTYNEWAILNATWTGRASPDATNDMTSAQYWQPNNGGRNNFGTLTAGYFAPDIGLRRQSHIELGLLRLVPLRHPGESFLRDTA